MLLSQNASPHFYRGLPEKQTSTESNRRRKKKKSLNLLHGHENKWQKSPVPAEGEQNWFATRRNSLSVHERVDPAVLTQASLLLKHAAWHFRQGIFPMLKLPVQNQSNDCTLRLPTHAHVCTSPWWSRSGLLPDIGQLHTWCSDFKGVCLQSYSPCRIQIQLLGFTKLSEKSKLAIS